MFELILENKMGDQINFAQNTAFSITEIQGLNPPSAMINTSQIALMDGAMFNSSKLNVRTINVAFAIEYAAALNRIEVYKVLKSKQWIKLTYNGQYRQVAIEGYIGSIDISYFDMKQIVTCSIICPSPYLKSAQTIIDELQNVISTFRFPFSSTADPQIMFSHYGTDVPIAIENDGDVECGMIINVSVMGSVSDPKIVNCSTNEFIGVDYDFVLGDLITIDTRQGHKTVTLLRNGMETNLFNYVLQDSTWLQLPIPGASFMGEVGTGSNADLSIQIIHDNLYEGV